MNTIAYDKDGWLFPGQHLQTHDISYEDIQYLLRCAEIDDRWAAGVKKMVQDIDEHPERRGEFIIDELRIMNTSGTTIHFPFGDRIITFCSKRQFFRGENREFPCSVPSLRRKTMGKSEREEELMRTVANMRIWQFTKLIWNIRIVPYWEAKLSDVNYKALAQHYGFDTNLLDLTNDFRTALFFAACKYIPEQDCFRPLTEEEIKGKHKYGVIYHAPNWILDFISPGGSYEWLFQHMNDGADVRYGLDNGDLDGMAFQIGYQPFMRCHCQSGYVYPLRYGAPLNEDRRFEKMRFKQSAELSEQVFQMMDGGKKVFPEEGIAELREVFTQIQRSKRFSYDDLMCAYEIDMVNKALFPTADDMKKELEQQGYRVMEDEIPYILDPAVLESVNKKYEGKDLLEPIGRSLHFKAEDKRFRDQRCMEIYGEMI